jgi:hypothetical protein
MPSRLIQGRASSFYDGGRAGGDARCATSTTRSRFVLRLRVGTRVALAGLLATLVAGIDLNALATNSRAVSWGRCLVSPSPDGAPQGVSEGGGEGSEPGSHRAPGTGSSCELPPRS